TTKPPFWPFAATTTFITPLSPMPPVPDHAAVPATLVPGGKPLLKSVEKPAALTSTLLVSNENRPVRVNLRVLGNIVRLVCDFWMGPTHGKKSASKCIRNVHIVRRQALVYHGYGLSGKQKF